MLWILCGDSRPRLSGGATSPLRREEDAAGVAQPDAVGGPAMKADVGGKSVGAFENFAQLAGLPRRR